MVVTNNDVMKLEMQVVFLFLESNKKSNAGLKTDAAVPEE